MPRAFLRCILNLGGVMKRAGSAISISLAIFCWAGTHAPAREGNADFKNIAMEIVRFAKANDINKISVLGYTGKDGVEKNEADYISEKMGAYLAGHGKPALIERALLEKVLRETRLSSSAGADGDKSKFLKDIFLIDAVVTGTVFAAGKKLKVLTRLIDLETGRVLLAAQSESEREWTQFPEVPDMELEWDNSAWPLPPSDFRDAPSDLRDAASDTGRVSCADRKLRLTGLNSELVDAKALYWAAKMKEPGFSIRGLSRNPGTEITDPEVKSRFYKLLGAYYRSENAPPPAPDKLPAIINLIEEEKRAYDECGQR